MYKFVFQKVSNFFDSMLDLMLSLVEFVATSKLCSVYRLTLLAAVLMMSFAVFIYKDQDASGIECKNKTYNMSNFGYSCKYTASTPCHADTEAICKLPASQVSVLFLDIYFVLPLILFMCGLVLVIITVVYVVVFYDEFALVHKLMQEKSVPRIIYYIMHLQAHPHVTTNLMFTMNKMEYLAMANIVFQHMFICLIYNQQYVIFWVDLLSQPFFQLPYYAECKMNRLDFETCYFPSVRLIVDVYTILCVFQLVIFCVAVLGLVYRYLLSRMPQLAQECFLRHVRKSNPDLPESMAVLFFQLTKNVDVSIIEYIRKGFTPREFSQIIHLYIGEKGYLDGSYLV